MNPQPNPIAVKSIFGPFELNSATGELTKFGTRVRLQGQPLEILSILAGRAGEIVSRDELQQRLWSGNTFVDFESGLNSAVNKLRQALGDSADSPRYIETIPGKGYRFIAPLERVSSRPLLELAPPAERSAPAVIKEDARPTAKRWLPLAAIALVCLALGYWAGSRRPGAATSARRLPVRFTISPPPGRIMNPPSTRQTFALSPDGAHLAFSAMNASGAFELFIRDLDSLESRPAPNSQGAYHMFWAPDSRSLFFTAGGKLRRMPLTGGEAGHQVLGDVPSFMFSGVVLDRDRVLVSGRRRSAYLPTAGGALEFVKETYRWPVMLPDGRHMIDIAFDTNGRHRARVVRFGDPKPVRELMETSSRVEYTPSMSRPGAGYLVYIRGGNLMVHPFDPAALRLTGDPTPIAHGLHTFLPSGSGDFSVSQNGIIAYETLPIRSHLAWVDRKGHEIAAISPGNLAVKTGRLSPDGRFVAAAVYDPEQGKKAVWIFDTTTNTGRVSALREGCEDTPVWSNDSKSIVINSAHVEAAKLFLRHVGKTEPDIPLPRHEYQISTDWSSDGRYVAFMNTGFGRYAYEDNGDIYAIDMKATPERKMFPLLKSAFHEAHAVWSPDGEWLSFLSTESGRPEIYLQRFERGDTPSLVGERFPVTKSGAQCIRWRRDGKELYYLSFDGRIYAVPVKLGPRPSFGSPTALFQISTEARAATHSLVGFDVSPDGQRFVIPVVSGGEDPVIVIIQNWEP